VTVLYVFAGLPGAGKTELARRLAQDLRAVYLRIDSIEEALIASSGELMGPEGYVVAYALAADNLRLGGSVVADCVNPVSATRNSWRGVAARCGTDLVDIEIRCSDREEHRRRVESRALETSTRKLTWAEVVARDYERWDTPPLCIDTAGRTAAESYAELRKKLGL
jgi:predicted kinase